MTRIYRGIGLGTFPFAGPFTPVSPDNAKDILQRYIDCGGTYIDTAPTYARGAVEELLGGYLRGIDRKLLVLATSCGYVQDTNGNYQVSGKFNDVIEDCKQSLRRLQTDYIDVYYSHIPDPATPKLETISALRELREMGLIKAIGVWAHY